MKENASGFYRERLRDRETFRSKSIWFECDTFRNSPYEFSEHIMDVLNSFPERLKATVGSVYTYVSLWSESCNSKSNMAVSFMTFWWGKDIVFCIDPAWSWFFLIALVEDRWFKWQDFGFKAFLGIILVKTLLFRHHTSYILSPRHLRVSHGWRWWVTVPHLEHFPEAVLVGIRITLRAW